MAIRETVANVGAGAATNKISECGDMADRLTDKQRKKIASEYIEIGNYREVGRRNGVSMNTVRNIVKKETDVAQKLADKKEQNTADILAHMETKRDKVNEIVDVYLEKLLDPAILEKATPSQLTTALGTLIDKWTMAKGKDRDVEDLAPLAELLKKK